MSNAELFNKLLTQSTVKKIVKVPLPGAKEEAELEIRSCSEIVLRECHKVALKKVAEDFECAVKDLNLDSSYIKDAVNGYMVKEVVCRTVFMPNSNTRAFISTDVLENMHPDTISVLFISYNNVQAEASISVSVGESDTYDSLTELIDKLKKGALDSENFLVRSSAISQARLLSILIDHIKTLETTNSSLGYVQKPHTSKTKPSK